MNMNNFKDKNFLYFYTQKQKETYQKYFSNSANFDENFRKLLKKEFEYLGKTYNETKRRPIFIARERIGFDEDFL